MQHYAHGEVILSVRFNDEQQYLELDKKLRQMIPLRRYGKQLHFQIEGSLRRNPMQETNQVAEFYGLVRELSTKLDIRITREHRWSTSDICFVDPDKYILDGFGPLGQKEHDRSEYILRHSLGERALLMAMTLKEIEGV
jgi:D-alanine-D-alanine ligase